MHYWLNICLAVRPIRDILLLPFIQARNLGYQQKVVVLYGLFFQETKKVLLYTWAWYASFQRRQLEILLFVSKYKISRLQKISVFSFFLYRTCYIYAILTKGKQYAQSYSDILNGLSNLQWISIILWNCHVYCMVALTISAADFLLVWLLLCMVWFIIF